MGWIRQETLICNITKNINVTHEGDRYYARIHELKEIYVVNNLNVQMNVWIIDMQ